MSVEARCECNGCLGDGFCEVREMAPQLPVRVTCLSEGEPLRNQCMACLRGDDPSLCEYDPF